MHFSEPGPSKDFHKSWGKNDDGLLSDGKKMMTNDRVSWKMASHSGFTFTHEFAILSSSSYSNKSGKGKSSYCVLIQIHSLENFSFRNKIITKKMEFDNK